MKTFWDQIDAILVINLEDRKDRWIHITSQLDRIGVRDKVYRIDAIRGRALKSFGKRPWFRETTPEPVAFMKGGSAGCCLSQKKAINFALEKGFETILLMEDDALFNNDLTGEVGTFLGNLLEDASQWDMLYLGFYQKLNKHWIGPTLDLPELTLKTMRIRGPLMNHAIVMNRKVMKLWSERLPDVDNIWSWMTYWGSIDSWVQNQFGRDKSIKIWGTEPRLVVQLANQSDIVGRVLSKAESEGTHRPTTLIPLSFSDFEASIDLSFWEKIYQPYKRYARVLKAYLFGYKRT